MDSYCGYKMAETAENLADRYGITREDADRCAERSRRCTSEAWESGVLDQEVVPVEISTRRMDLVEVNEAFASQYLAVEKEMNLEPEKVNVDGGAIALSDPLAASGARITTHLIHALRRRGLRRGLGSACIGSGHGMAVILECP